MTKRPAMCGHCLLNSAGEHEAWCPLHPTNRLRQRVENIPSSLNVELTGDTNLLADPATEREQTNENN